MRTLLDTLGEEGTQRIHEASLDVLESIGVRVHSPELLQFLAGSDAVVDDQGFAFLPREVVLRALSTAPSEVVLWHRDGKRIPLQDTNYVHGVATGALYIWDFVNREHRPATRRDVGDMTRLADALPNLEVLSQPVQVGGVPGLLATLYGASTTMANTTKHCMIGAPTAQEFSFWVELAEILNHGRPLAERPIISVVVCTLSPLQLDGETARIILLAARKGIPFLALPAPMAGATSPVTAAGTLLVQNVEALFLLTTAQMLAPGLPVIYGAADFIMDPRSGACSRSVEHPSWISAVAAFGRFYGLPSYVSVSPNWTGFPDLGTGVQKACYHLAALMSGVDLTKGAGRVGIEVMSYEQLVVDNALVEMLRRFVRGVDIKGSDWPRSAMDEVTMKEELDDQMCQEAESDGHVPQRLPNVGGLGLADASQLDRAHYRVKDILEIHRPAVPEVEIQAIEDYVNKKEKELSGLE